MKLEVDVKLDLKTKEAQEKVRKAVLQGLRDTIADVAQDAVNLSPVKTGNNRRSIKYEVSGMGSNEVVDPKKMEAAVYSTSGYGGFLETGTSKMAARPYFKPSMDKHKDEIAPNIRRYL